MKTIIHMLVVAVLLLLTLPIMAQAEIDTLDILNRAGKGDSKAQYQLGRMYCEGGAVTRNYGKAEEWFHKAADQGHAGAQLWLGYMYDPENGVFRREEEAEILYGVKPSFPIDAEKWYRKAAEQGLAQAQLELAWYYMRGYGSLGGSEEQFKWLAKAAEQNVAEAQWHLGHAYRVGVDVCGIEKDLVRAYMWFDLATASDSTGIGKAAVKSRDAVAREMTQDQIQDANSLIQKWKAKRIQDKGK
jgi:TPR repeat protein